jgi:hypothetical protein
MKEKLKCIECGQELTGQQKRFCSRKCNNRFKHTNIPNKKHKKLRQHQRRLELIIALGAKCELCGYKKNLAALHFHHKDPSMKVFALEGRNIGKHSWDVLLTEAAKCQLLCSNCHMELHFPDLNDKV